MRFHVSLHGSEHNLINWVCIFYLSVLVNRISLQFTRLFHFILIDYIYFAFSNVSTHFLRVLFLKPLSKKTSMTDFQTFDNFYLNQVLVIYF